MFAGLGLDETPGLTAVAEVIVHGTAVSTLFLEGLRAIGDGEYQLLLLFAMTGDDVAAGAMSEGPAPAAAGSLEGVPQPRRGMGTYKGVCIPKA